MMTRTGMYGALIALAALLIAGVPQVANAQAAEKLELLGPGCWADRQNNVIEYQIKLSQLDSANPITAANINLTWSNSECCGTCQVDCWELIDIAPAPGWDELGSQNCQCGDNCKCIQYSLTRSLNLPGVTEDSIIAVVTFRVTLPLDKCCIETLTLVPGSGASATKVAGEGYVRDVPGGLVLGDPLSTRIDRQDPVIVTCPKLTRCTNDDVCTWTPGLPNSSKASVCQVVDFVYPTATDNCDTCNCTLQWYYQINKVCCGPDQCTPENPNWIPIDITDPENAIAMMAFPRGCTYISWMVVDCCGNHVCCCQIVEVEDHQAPVIKPKVKDRTVKADKNCVYIVPDVRELFEITDNCTVDPDVTQIPQPGTVWDRGEHDISVSANDQHGNNVTAVFLIEVVDKTPPEFTQLPAFDIADPPTIVRPADAGKCSAKVSWIIAADDAQCNDPVTITCDHCSGGVFPIGDTSVTCTATDPAGNSTSTSFTVTVLPIWKLDVTVGMKGYVNKKPFDRCVLVEVADCTGNLPAQTTKGTLTFVDGVAKGVLDLKVPEPCVQGTYNCARAKDFRHSLWSGVSTADPNGFIDGTVFKVKFVGDDALRLGNLNGDMYIDIVDWVIWRGQFLTPQPLPAEDCTDPLPNLAIPANQSADVSGDAKVTAIDYGHIYVNNFQEDDSPCCLIAGVRLAGGAGPRTRIAVSELKDMGLGYAAAFDANGDGYVDVADIQLSQAVKK